MLFNADFDSEAYVDADRAPWVPSPLPGVERLLLDRIGEEVARATTLVRFAPASRFDRHEHGGGEEFLVLDGVFSDDTGDFGPGSYVRNPVGSAHAPWSEPGCVIFVKLCQFQPGDDAVVRIDTAAGEWEAGPEDGVLVQPLHRYGRERVDLVRFDRPVEIDLGTDGAGVEILVLEGRVDLAEGFGGRWCWLRHPPGGPLGVTGAPGTRLWVKSGHLDPPIGV